ncbi:MAG: tetratricopeptide repeat protein [Planctomycetota bacterium]
MHFGRDPWFRCGTWFGLSWGYVLCDDPWDQWTWCYRYGGYYPVYVYYPYPYPRYSYVDLGYVDEARAYPPLPAVSYIDDGGSSTTLVDRGNELFHGGDYVSAAEAYRQAILADLSNATAKFGYARALFALGNYPFAALAIRMGMKLAPDWPVVGGDLRDGYGNTQDFTAHAQALDRYRSERPDDPAALLVAGYVHYFTGDFDRAATDFDRLVQANASDEVAKRFAEVAAGARSSAGAQRIAPAAAGDDRGW